MYNFLLNVLFIFAIVMGGLFFLYFLLTIYDFFNVQKEHNSRVIFKDKMSFFCAALILVYMYVNEFNKLGMALFVVLLFSSFMFNFVCFSKNSMLLFNNKISYENIEAITIDANPKGKKKFLSIKLKTMPKEMYYFLTQGDFDFLLENLKNKEIEIKFNN